MELTLISETKVQPIKPRAPKLEYYYDMVDGGVRFLVSFEDYGYGYNTSYSIRGRKNNQETWHCFFGGGIPTIFREDIALAWNQFVALCEEKNTELRKGQDLGHDY